MASQRAMAQNRASKAFTNVSSPASLRNDAQKWVRFIRAEQKAVEDRCEFIADLKETTCFDDIDQAYKNVIFNGGEFVLRDESCLTFKPSYDSKFRISTSQQDG